MLKSVYNLNDRSFWMLLTKMQIQIISNCMSISSWISEMNENWIIIMAKLLYRQIMSEIRILNSQSMHPKSKEISVCNSCIIKYSKLIYKLMVEVQTLMNFEQKLYYIESSNITLGISENCLCSDAVSIISNITIDNNHSNV